MKHDFSKCTKKEKIIFEDQICFLQCIFNNNCSIDKEECEALIK